MRVPRTLGHCSRQGGIEFRDDSGSGVAGLFWLETALRAQCALISMHEEAGNLVVTEGELINSEDSRGQHANDA